MFSFKNNGMFLNILRRSGGAGALLALLAGTLWLLSAIDVPVSSPKSDLVDQFSCDFEEILIPDSGVKRINAKVWGGKKVRSANRRNLHVKTPSYLHRLAAEVAFYRDFHTAEAIEAEYFIAYLPPLWHISRRVLPKRAGPPDCRYLEA